MNSRRMLQTSSPAFNHSGTSNPVNKFTSQEAARAKVENEISRDTLELSNAMTRVERLKKSLTELDGEIYEKNEIISRSENEIIKRNAVIERKQGLIDQYNKRVEAVVSEQGVSRIYLIECVKLIVVIFSISFIVLQFLLLKVQGYTMQGASYMYCINPGVPF